ncbi:hypothetical protein ACMATS_06090 [Streptoverticillium reticulum]|uniref:hypothetical protein n=1 Tax=Streptoverticillium reticulum TaxID=1433415 RepID=UPI0039BF17D2
MNEPTRPAEVNPTTSAGRATPAKWVRIYRDGNGIGQVEAGVRKFTDSNLPQATSYSYFVRAVDDQYRESTDSNHITAKTGGTPLEPPTNVRVSQTDKFEHAYVEWDHTGREPQGFMVRYRKIGDEQWTERGPIPPSLNSTYLRNPPDQLEPGTTYELTVGAVSFNPPESATSAPPVRFTTRARLMTPVTELKVAGLRNDTVGPYLEATWAWEKGTSPADPDHFRIRYTCISGSCHGESGTLTATPAERLKDITGVRPATTYQVEVTTVGPPPEGDESTTERASATTPDNPPTKG